MLKLGRTYWRLLPATYYLGRLYKKGLPHLLRIKKYSQLKVLAEWNGRLSFVWGCARLPGSPYKKPTSEIFSAARTPRRERRPPSCSELIWEEQVSLTANLLSSTTPASAAAVSNSHSFSGCFLVLLPLGTISGRRLPEVLASASVSYQQALFPT